MNKIYSNFVSIITLLILTLILIVVILAISITTKVNILSINTQISINDIIDNFISIVNLVVILYIADIINKRAEKDKSEKDIIITLIKNMMNDIDNIYILLPSSPELPSLTIRLKDLYLDFKFLNSSILALSKNPLDEILSKEFINNFRKFNNACTNKNITVIDNKLHYSFESIQKINKQKSDLKLTLLKALSSYI